MTFLNFLLQAGLLSVDRTPVCFKTKFEDEVLDSPKILPCFVYLLFCHFVHHCIVRVLIKMSAYCLRLGQFEICDSVHNLDRYISI